jgi:hypothetical protein
MRGSEQLRIADASLAQYTICSSDDESLVRRTCWSILLSAWCRSMVTAEGTLERNSFESNAAACELSYAIELFKDGMPQSWKLPWTSTLGSTRGKPLWIEMCQLSHTKKDHILARSTVYLPTCVIFHSRRTSIILPTIKQRVEERISANFASSQCHVARVPYDEGTVTTEHQLPLSSPARVPTPHQVS